MAEMILEPEVIELPEIDISHIETEDDTPVDNIFSEKQQRLLTESLYTSWEADTSFIALANVGLFYAVYEPPVVPDVMVSLDVTPPPELWEKRHRSYFMWEYGKPPDVVVEVVSNTKGNELESKKAVYARLGIAYYIVYDPERQLSDSELHVFERRGDGYVLADRPWLPGLGLGVTLWSGSYEGIEAIWLRWCDAAGKLVPTGSEASQSARQQAETERQRAQAERERAEKLAEKLQALGIDPDELEATE
jgi:Uma2 family endonuclease